MAGIKKNFNCKFCKKPLRASYGGLCQRCYQYFKVNNGKIFEKPEYGTIGIVIDKNSPQYNMRICHICGMAYTKLQQHIYYAHDMSKKEYCDMFGLDHKARLTTDNYNKKMRDYAYKYDMDKQLITAGENTRFQKGHDKNYIRSYQTQQRLKINGKNTINKNRRNKK